MKAMAMLAPAFCSFTFELEFLKVRCESYHQHTTFLSTDVSPLQIRASAKVDMWTYIGHLQAVCF